MKEQVVINGLLINFYKFSGKGDGVLIFLHGWRSNGLVWQNAALKLAKDGFLVYALDLPGFGESALPKNAFTLQDYADIVTQFLKKTGIKKATLIGHSFGGRISIMLSATKPELVEKVVLVDSAGLILNRRTALKTIAKLVKPFFKPKFMKTVREKIYEKIGAEDYVATPELRETFLNLINEDLTNYLPKIKQPVLLIWGDKDKDAPIEAAALMHQNIKNSKLVTLENTGHFSFLDKPDQFYKELIKFIC